MKANTGMNLLEFFQVVENITKLRSESLTKKLSTDVRRHQDCNDLATLKRKFFSLMTSLSHLIEMCIQDDANMAEVPFEILDFCYLAPVVIDMCPYYRDKKLQDEFKFMEILKVCLLYVGEFEIFLAAKLGAESEQLCQKN